MSTLTEDDIVGLANQYGVPPELALATWAQESNSGQNVRTSKKGATGDFQVTPIAAADVGMPNADLSDPKVNATVGIKYLAKGYNKYGSAEGAAAFYHAGPDFASKLQQNPNLSDGGIRTIDYVKQVSSKYHDLKGDSSAKLTPAVYHPTDDPVNMGTINVSAAKDESEPVDNSTEETAETSQTPQPSGAPDDYSYLIDSSTPYPGGTIEVVAKKPIDQNSVEDSLGSLLKQSSAMADSVIADSVALRDKLKTNLKATADSYGREGELQATTVLEKFRAEQQADGERASVLSKFGVNSGDADNQIAQLAHRMLEESDLATAYEDRIAAKNSSSFFDNPLGAIMDSLTVNDDIRAHNQVVAAMHSQKERLAELTETAHSINIANAAKFGSTTFQGAQAAAEVQREIARQKSLEVDDKLSRIDLDTQLHTLAAVQSKISSLSALDNQLTNRGIREDAAAEKQRKTDLLQAQDQQAIAAGKVLGINIQGLDDLKRQNPRIRDAVERIIANGGEADGKISDSPLEAERILSTGNLTKMTPATQQISHMLTAAKQEAVKQLQSPQGQQIAGKGKEEVARFLDAKMREILSNHIQQPSIGMQYDGLGVTTNPFRMPTLQNMAVDPNSKDLKLTKTLTDFKALAGPGVELTDGLIFQLAMQGVGKQYKDLTEAARDVSDYYKAGITRNNMTYHQDSFGLPVQTTYMGDANTDLASYKSVMAAMLKLSRAAGPLPAVESAAGPLAPAVKAGEKAGNSIIDYLSNLGKP